MSHVVDPHSGASATSRSKVATDLVFDASLQKLTINDEDFETLLFVTNATDGIVIYDPNNTATKGAAEGNVVTLIPHQWMINLIVIYEPTEEIEVEANDLLLCITQELKK